MEITFKIYIAEGEKRILLTRIKVVQTLNRESITSPLKRQRIVSRASIFEEGAQFVQI